MVHGFTFEKDCSLSPELWLNYYRMYDGSRTYFQALPSHFPHLLPFSYLIHLNTPVLANFIFFSFAFLYLENKVNIALEPLAITFLFLPPCSHYTSQKAKMFSLKQHFILIKTLDICVKRPYSLGYEDYRIYFMWLWYNSTSQSLNLYTISGRKP